MCQDLEPENRWLNVMPVVKLKKTDESVSMSQMEDLRIMENVSQLVSLLGTRPIYSYSHYDAT